MKKVILGCYYFEGGVCGNPDIDAGEVSWSFCKKCKGRKEEVKPKRKK